MLLSRQDYMTTLDVTGLHCPQPVIKCKAVLATLDNGEILHMVSTDRDAPREIKQLISYSGNRLCNYQLVDNKHHFQIEKCKPRSQHKLSQTLMAVQRSISNYFQFNWRFLYRLFCLSPQQPKIIKGE